MRWYTFKRIPVQQPPTTLTIEVSEETGVEPPEAVGDANDAEGSDAEDGGDDEDEELPEENLPPPPALKALYSRGDGKKFLLAMGGWARGALFECSWEVRKPTLQFIVASESRGYTSPQHDFRTLVVDWVSGKC